MKRWMQLMAAWLMGGAALAAPSVTGFAPASGGPGVQVTLTGAGLASATKVEFGDALADFTATVDNRLVAVVPPTATTGKIRVTNPTGNGSSAGNFTVAPRITAFAPPRSATNTEVTIHGFNFTGTTNVQFSGRSATFSAVGPTEIRARVPFGATNGPIAVTSPAGSAESPVDFQVSGPGPIIDSFSQPVGAPGLNLTIAGANFTNVTGVRFNGVAATVFSAPAHTQLHVTVPPAATTGKVIVTTTSGSGTSLVNFVVSRAPYVTNFTPTFGKAGSTLVTIEGFNFTGLTGVGFNGKPVGGLDTSVAGKVKVTVPPAATTGPIAVTNSSGFGISSRDFVVTSAPIIDSFDTGAGPVGTLVVIRGANFASPNPTNWVYFKGAAAVRVRAAADTQLNVTVPPGATTGPIAVTNVAGAGTVSSDLFYVTTTVPFITRISPDFGPRSTEVEIYGLSFGTTPTVKFNGVTDTTAVVLGQVGSETLIQARVPAAATTGPITVTATGGTSTNHPRFYIPPRLTSFAPTNGIVGTGVTLSGTNFTDAFSVRLGSAETDFTVTASNRITFPVPTEAATGPITVETPGGTIISEAGFGVLPHIDSFAPALGPPGTEVTVRGTSFQNASALLFNNVAAVFTNVASTELRATVPAGATTGPLRVTTPGGTAVSSNSFLVTGASDLALSLEASAAVAEPGAPVAYHLQVVNQGVAVVSEVVVTNRLPAGAVFDSAIASRGTCTHTSGIVTCAVGLLTNGTSVTIDIAAHLPVEGVWTNQAGVDAREDDPNPANNSDTAVTVVVGDASRGLTIAPVPGLEKVVIAWPTSAVPFTLQSAGGLAATQDWTVVPAAPVVKAGQNVVTNSTARPSEFFRLRRP